MILKRPGASLRVGKSKTRLQILPKPSLASSSKTKTVHLSLGVILAHPFVINDWSGLNRLTWNISFGLIVRFMGSVWSGWRRLTGQTDVGLGGTTDCQTFSFRCFFMFISKPIAFAKDMVTRTDKRIARILMMDDRRWGDGFDSRRLS